jgi:hypothetical protein
MPNAPTPNLGLTVPTVAADISQWGTELNTDLAILDQLGTVPVASVSSNFNVLFSTASPEVTYWCTTGAAGITATLPSAASFPGHTVVFKKLDASAGMLFIVSQAGQFVEGAGGYEVPNKGNVVKFRSDGGVNWWLIT